MPKRLDTPACRTRMYEQMGNDDEDREVVTRAVLRQQESMDSAAQPSAEGASHAQPQANAHDPERRARLAREERQVQNIVDEEEIPEHGENIDDEVEIASELPEGDEETHGNEDADDSNDEIEEDPMDENSNSDEEMPITAAEPAAQREPRPREEDGEGHGSTPTRPKKRRGMGDEFNEYDDKLLSLRTALKHVSMKKVLEDLEEDP